MEDFVENWAHNMRRKFYRLVEFVGAVCRDACRDLRNWRRFRWRDMLYYLGLCGEKSVAIVLLICFLTRNCIDWEITNFKYCTVSC